MGRQAEIEELSTLLTRARLLTLVGPPGCGKTRLALEVVAPNRHRVPQDVAFVDLGPIGDPDAVVDAASMALGLQAQPAPSLVNVIGDRAVLLLIDNAEHLIMSVCSLAQQLLAGCSNLRIMATSRELLNVDGERCWPVEPLSVPVGDAQDPEAVGAYDAVSLFCVRVSEQQPAFRLTTSNAAAVATICHRLDGIPLALELAAAAVPSLGLTQIAASLHHSFRILTNGRRTAVPRHRTIRAAIEWSHDLLDDDEQLLFRRLALFPGTFDLNAVKAICADGNMPEEWVSETLSRLVAKSLIVARTTPAGDLRYGQLEIVRQFARDKRALHGTDDLDGRHARYYARLADALSIVGGDLQARVHLIDLEYANLRLALDWAVGHEPGLEAATTENLQWYWALRGMLREARDRLESVLARSDVDELVAARLRILAATASRRLGDSAGMRAHLERASTAAEPAGAPALSVWTASARGLLAAQDGDWSAAEVWFRRILQFVEDMPADAPDRIVRMHGWPPSRARSSVMARNNLALTLLQLGRPSEALEQIVQALDATDDVVERAIPLVEVLDTCGQVYLALGRQAEARAQFIAALAQAVANANDHMAVGPLFGLARVAAGDGDHVCALTFAAAARQAASSSGTDWIRALSYQLESIEQAERSSREALSARRAAIAWQHGWGMDIRAALQFAQVGGALTSRTILSTREGEVAHMVANGLTDKEIAQRLLISPRTVEVHLAHVRRKLGLRNRAEIAAWAVSEASEA